MDFVLEFATFRLKKSTRAENTFYLRFEIELRFLNPKFCVELFLGLKVVL